MIKKMSFLTFKVKRPITIMVISFRTDRSGQTQIRLILEVQSDQGLHCLQCHLHLLDEIP